MVNQIIFSSILQTWYVELRISRSISESPLEFEITRVDCNCYGLTKMHKSIEINGAWWVSPKLPNRIGKGPFQHSLDYMPFVYLPVTNTIVPFMLYPVTNISLYDCNVIYRMRRYVCTLNILHNTEHNKSLYFVSLCTESPYLMILLFHNKPS